MTDNTVFIDRRVISLKTIATIIPTVAAIFGGMWAIDSHYASAADIAALQKSTEQQVITVQRSLESQVRSLRQERADDEIFKLQMKKQAQKGRLSPEDAAMLERFLRRSAETNREQQAADIANIIPEKKK